MNLQPTHLHVQLVEYDKMFDFFKNLIGEKCHQCGERIKGEGITRNVKIPGYTGSHERHFCCIQHYEDWKEFRKDWEDKNHKIPDSNKGPTCVNCMRGG